MVRVMDQNKRVVLIVSRNHKEDIEPLVEKFQYGGVRVIVNEDAYDDEKPVALYIGSRFRGLGEIRRLANAVENGSM